MDGNVILVFRKHLTRVKKSLCHLMHMRPMKDMVGVGNATEVIDGLVKRVGN